MTNCNFHNRQNCKSYTKLYKPTANMKDTLGESEGATKFEATRQKLAIVLKNAVEENIFICSCYIYTNMQCVLNGYVEIVFSNFLHTKSLQ